MAGGDDNHDDGGGRSSGEARAVATVHNRSNRLGFWDPGVVLSTVVCLDVTRVSSSHGDLVASGNELSGSAEPVVSGRNRHRGEEGSVRGLTAMTTERSATSRTVRSRQIGRQRPAGLRRGKASGRFYGASSVA